METGPLAPFGGSPAPRMSRHPVWMLGKALEVAGLIVILIGVSISIHLGFQDEGLSSMREEFRGLLIGGGLFALGYVLERWAGRR